MFVGAEVSEFQYRMKIRAVRSPKYLSQNQVGCVGSICGGEKCAVIAFGSCQQGNAPVAVAALPF